MARPTRERQTPVDEPDLAPGQARRLADTRAAKNLSFRALSERSGVSVASIQAIENGTGTGSASCRTMARLADALGVPRGWLAFGG